MSMLLNQSVYKGLAFLSCFFFCKAIHHQNTNALWGYLIKIIRVNVDKIQRSPLKYFKFRSLNFFLLSKANFLVLISKEIYKNIFYHIFRILKNFKA